MLKSLVDYLRQLNITKQILWCYLLWYLTMSSLYFDPAIHIWLTSLGISSIIGIALILSVSNGGTTQRDRWTTARLFMMPFCVSSFSALVKSHGFILFLSPKWKEDALAMVIIGVFLSITALLRNGKRASTC